MDKLNIEDLINPKVKDDPGTSEPNSTDDLIKLIAVKNLLSKDTLKTNTRIKYSQVDKLSKLYLFSEVFNTSLTEKLANNILELQISINGLGRKELVELVGKVYNPFESLENDKQRKKEVFR